MRSKRKASRARNGDGWKAKWYPSYNKVVGEVRRNGKIVKRIYGTLGVNTDGEKRAVEALLKKWVDLPSKIDPSTTMQVLMDAWAGREGDLAATTRDRYKKVVKYLSGPLGGKRLIDVEAADVEAAINGITGNRGKTMARTKQIAYMFLHGLFEQQVERRAITFNPCNGVKTPKYWREAEPTIFTRAEQQFLKDAARSTPYYALLLLALSVPVRIGELLGIRRRDVNLSKREIDIRMNLSESAENKYKPTLGALKTRESRRELPMNNEVVAAFTALLQAQMAAGRSTPDTPVFLSPEGTYARHTHLFSRWFRPLLEAAQIEAEKAARAAGDRHYKFPVGASLYDLRHTACANWVEEGVPMPVFHVLAGHANSATTLKHYTKVTDKARHAAVDAAHRWLQEPESGRGA